MTDQQNTHLVLLQRYENLIQAVRPDVRAKKAESPDNQSRLELPHIMWMIQKMKDPNFKPLTTNSAWISWIQAGLYYSNLINPDFEKDLTRSVLKQYQE